MYAASEPGAQLIEILRTRREQVRFRASIAVLMALFFTNMLGLAPMTLWVASYCALQVLELRMFPRAALYRDPPGRLRERCALALLFMNGVVFGSASLMWATSVGSWGLACGGFLLAGSMLNVVMTTPASKPAFAVSIAPYFAYVAITPLFAMSESGGEVAAALAIAGAMMCYCAVKLWIESSRTRASEISARQELALALSRAEAANTAKSTFLATVSHEIRTPLNGVLGMAQAMAAEPLSPPQQGRLQVIRESGEGLLAILNDVLDLSKIEAGKLELEEIVFDLEELVRGVQGAFAALAQEKGLVFAVDVDDAAGAYRGDPTRIRQILYNLVSNALKFTQDGEVRVSGRYTGAVLEFQVADTGIGMTEAALGHLFASFSQADASTTRRFGGTGLGLAISRNLAELMHGSITVESQAGIGSCFTVKIPLPRAPRAERPAPPTLDVAPEAPRELRVLAAEDNAVNQLVLRTLLQQVGIEPVIVANGAQAVEVFETGEFDLILMDVQMPEMDGPTATQIIRRREAETGRPRIPIIALTANVMSHQVAEYRQAGMDGHVAKPIEAGMLFAALQQSLADLSDPADEAMAV